MNDDKLKLIEGVLKLAKQYNAQQVNCEDIIVVMPPNYPIPEAPTELPEELRQQPVAETDDDLMFYSS